MRTGAVKVTVDNKTYIVSSPVVGSYGMGDKERTAVSYPYWATRNGERFGRTWFALHDSERKRDRAIVAAAQSAFGADHNQMIADAQR